MGTNVYVIRKEISEEATKLLEKYQKTKYTKFFYQFWDKFQEEIEKNKIHIGKRSAGWKFLFNHNNWKYYDYTEESIKNFLQSCDRIYDEYNNDLSVEEFWEHFVESGKDGFDGQDYYKYELERTGSNELEALNKRTALKLYNNAMIHNWYEEQKCKGKKIPYDALNYRFSSSTEFS